MAPRAKSTAVLTVNRGLYLDRPVIAIPAGGWSDCLNVEPKLGSVSAANLGWTRFEAFSLLGPVRLIDRMKLQDGTEELLFGDPENLYRFNPSTKLLELLNRRYVTGTASVVAGATPIVTGVGTLWLANTKVGDYIRFGSATENSPTAAWYRITTVTDNTHLVVAGPVAGAPLGAAVYTIRKTFTGDYLNTWDAVTFVNADPDNDDAWFATNGIDPVVKWHSGDAEVVEANFGQDLIVTALAVYSNMLILIGFVKAGDPRFTSIINSDVGKPEETAAGLAGEFIVHSGTEPLISGDPLGDNLVLYTERGGILVQFVGDPLVFTFRRAFSGIGPLGPRAIADFGDHHEFLGADTQYGFDGANVQEINNHLWREALSGRDASRNALITALFDEENAALCWALPLTTDPDAVAGVKAPAVAFSQHYLEDVGPNLPTPFAKRSFPFTAAGTYIQQSGITWANAPGTWATVDQQWNEQLFFAAFPLNLVGGPDGRVYILGAGQDADGTALASFVRMGRQACGDGRMRGLLARVYPFARSPGGGGHDLSLTVRLFGHASGNPESSEAFPFDLGHPEEGHFVSTFRRGRFLELEYGTAGPDEDWQLDGYDTDIKQGGKR